MVLGHQHGRPGIPEHADESLRRMVGIERQVGAAGLQNAQDPHEAGGPPVEVETHNSLRPHA